MHSLEQRIPEIITQAKRIYCQPETALDMIRQYQGMIPVAILPAENHRVVWLDVGDYWFKEWKFRYSIETAVQHQNSYSTMTTDLCLLTSDDVLTDCLPPSGFIFQMSLCGSTLLAKALAQSPHHLVINEATPLHEHLWQYLTRDWKQSVAMTADNLTLIRNLVLTLGRRRMHSQKNYFVKFRSWNVLFFDIIMRAFPEVPCLFLYRDPAEVIVSALKKEPTGYVRFKGTAAAAFMTKHSAKTTKEMMPLTYFVSLYEQYFLSILNSAYKNVTYLNYDQLNKEQFADILKHAFGYVAVPQHLALMQAQFNHYSKNDNGQVRFVPDKAAKQKGVTTEIRTAVNQCLASLYSQLELSDKNLKRSTMFAS